jgi:hypothetical protein
LIILIIFGEEYKLWLGVYLRLLCNALTETNYRQIPLLLEKYRNDCYVLHVTIFFFNIA